MTFSLTENQFSGKTYCYTIHPCLALSQTWDPWNAQTHEHLHQMPVVPNLLCVLFAVFTLPLVLVVVKVFVPKKIE